MAATLSEPPTTQRPGSSAVPAARRRAVSMVGLALLLALLGYLLWSLVRPSAPGAAPRVNPAVALGLLALATAALTWAYVVGQRAVVRAATRAKGRDLAILDADQIGATTDDESSAAWQQPGVEDRWRAGARRPWAGLLVMALALTMLAFSLWSFRSRTNEVVEHATRITAPVVDAGWTFAGLSHHPWVDVTYPGDAGMLTTRLFGVDPSTTPVGTQLTFIADDRDETRAQSLSNVEPSTAEQWLRFGLGTAALLGLFAALRAYGERTRDQRTLRSRSPITAVAVAGQDQRLYVVAPGEESAAAGLAQLSDQSIDSQPSAGQPTAHPSTDHDVSDSHPRASDDVTATRVAGPTLIARLPRGSSAVDGQEVLVVGASSGRRILVDTGTRLIGVPLPASYAQARHHLAAISQE